MRCALVIPTRNAGAHLDRLLPALAAQRRQPDSILVVDSRSSDDTVERFRAPRRRGGGQRPRPGR
ncbi:glycosyltransferase, partial [Pseudomonas aeruginosa]|nr:glycosyltransferase [Pseudomonas aeruginosa]